MATRLRPPFPEFPSCGNYSTVHLRSASDDGKSFRSGRLATHKSILSEKLEIVKSNSKILGTCKLPQLVEVPRSGQALVGISVDFQRHEIARSHVSLAGIQIKNITVYSLRPLFERIPPSLLGRPHRLRRGIQP